MDPVESQLTDLAQRLRVAWQACEDRTSPLGELAALAAATLAFYQERERGRDRRSQDSRTLGTIRHGRVGDGWGDHWTDWMDKGDE